MCCMRNNKLNYYHFSLLEIEIILNLIGFQTKIVLFLAIKKLFGRGKHFSYVSFYESGTF